MDLYRGKTAIVTGGASGIGRALCQQLGREGATVLVSDLDAEGATRVADAIVDAGGCARGVSLDVTDADAVQALVDDAGAEFGQLDYMVNNAGVAAVGEAHLPTLDQWRRVVDVNLMGMIHGTHAAYRAMVEQGHGHIVNVSSLAGLIGGPTMIPYATTKGAIVALSTSLRAEAAGLGVRVSVTCPGFVETGMLDAAELAGTTAEHYATGIDVGLMDPPTAARRILAGVARNRAIITFPFYARLAWWFCRLHPALVGPMMGRIVAHVRRGRTDG